MKKSIKTIAFALLTVGMLAGCKKPAPAPKDWSDEVKEAMNVFLGETLPYVDLNEETLYFDFAYEAGEAAFVVGDENDTNLLANYGDSLKEAGFKYVSSGSESYYAKENEAGYALYVSFDYYEATEQYEAGNEIYVESVLPEFHSWPEELVKFLFVMNDADYFEIPAFEAAEATFVADTYLYWGLIPYGAEVDVYGATEEESNLYLAELANNDWVISGDLSYGSATKAFPELDGIATIEFYFEEADSEAEPQLRGEALEENVFAMVAYFSMDPIPTQTWPAEKLAAAFETLGVPAFEVPGPDGEGLTFAYKFDKANLDYLDDPAYCYDRIKITGMDEDGLVAYVQKLQQAGWEGEADRWGDYTLTKHFDSAHGTATIMVEDYLAYSSNCVYVKVYYLVDPDPSEVWPAEDIAEMLGSDITDVLPQLVFQGALFKAYDDAYGMGVSCFVGEGNEEAAITAYVATLTAAGFTASDKAGVYVSPNDQFTVEPWIGTDGAVNLELALVRHLNAEIAAFLAKKGVTATLPDFAPYEADGVDWDYTGAGTSYYTAWVNGDHVAALASALAALGYTGTEEPVSANAGYLAYSPEDTITIQFAYVDSYEQTLIRVYPSHVS